MMGNSSSSSSSTNRSTTRQPFRLEEVMADPTLLGDVNDSNIPDFYKSVLLDQQGLEFRRKFDQTRHLFYLNQAISKGRQSVALLAPGDSSRPDCLVNLVTSLLRSFEQTGDVTVANEAIERAEAAIFEMPSEHPHRALVLSQLSNGFRMKYDQAHDLEDLNKAIDKGEKALAAVPNNMDLVHLAGIMAEQSTCLRRRFEAIGSLDDINEAVGLGESALAVSPADFPYRAAILTNLGACLMRQFERTGNLDQLNDAIRTGTEALSLMSPDHTDRGLVLNNLGNSFRFRFVRVGDLEDLDAAIKRGEEAVNRTPGDHPERGQRLINLAGSFFSRFEQGGQNLLDLDRAIERAEQASAAQVIDDDAQQALILNNLGVMLKCRFERTSNVGDLDNAIHHEEIAVAFTPTNSLERAARLINLAGSLFRRFEYTEDLDDLDRSVDLGEEAVKDLPPDHPQRASFLHTLTSSLSFRFHRRGKRSDLDKAISRAQEAVNLPNAPPKARIQAAAQATRMFAFVQDWKKVSDITATAVRLLPNVSPRALGQRDQQRILGEYVGLASTAASAALQAGRGASSAIELLELGRGIIMGLRFGTRTDLTDLRDMEPELAKKFERLREELDSEPPQTTLETSPGMSTAMLPKRSRHDVTQEFEKIVQDIHLLGPRFQNFLQPLSPDELIRSASFGPIVVINVSDLRCDALLITANPDRMWELPLPLLHHSDIKEKVKVPVTTALLEWLWRTTAGPILDELGFHKMPIAEGDWNRIWWIPTGLMGRLPIHAAGRHYANSTETVLDRVISSYSSSIKTLVYARQNTKQKERDLAKSLRQAVLVSMGRTPGASELRCAEQEVEIIDRILPAFVRREKLSRPLRRNVVASLDACTIFHFAGHARAHPQDPSRSCLLLTDWKSTPLTVEGLAGLKLYQKSPWLAYLSACSTGENDVDELQDEAINLVSACQLAGFPHVVGSLWEIDDEYSVHMALGVYNTIMRRGWTSEAVARGVHEAAAMLRSETRRVDSGAEYAIRDEGDPAIWAAYVHVGP